jgi:hypothetical protein
MPRREFSVVVEASPSSITRRIQDHTVGWRLKASQERPLYGAVEDGAFKVEVQSFTRRGWRVNNSGRPVLVGAVTSAGAGAQVDVAMRASYGAQFFSLIWALSVLLPVIGFAVAGAVGAIELSSSKALIPPALAPLIAPLIALPIAAAGPGIIWLGFRIEAAAAEQRLRAILTGGAATD